MGIELATIGTIMSIASAGASIMGGFAAKDEGKAQAAEATRAAEARGTEAARVSARQARGETEAADDLARRQKVAFLSSGVALQGSPLLMMEETRRRGAENAEEILAGGAAAGDAARAEGRVQAAQAKASGRQAFTQGLTTGMKTIGGSLA